MRRRLTGAAGIEVDHSNHDWPAPHGRRRGGDEVLGAFGYTATARSPDTSEGVVREHCAHIQAGEVAVAVLRR